LSARVEAQEESNDLQGSVQEALVHRLVAQQ
jgi:hypothetical protein